MDGERTTISGETRREGSGFVGVDLGSASVSVAHVGRRGARNRSLRTVRKPLPQEGLRPDARRGHVVRALREAVLELGVAGRPAATCVLGGDVLVRRLTLPRMSRADIHSSLLLECRRMVSFPVEEAELRYAIVGTGTGRDGSAELSLLVSAAHRRRVEEAREALAQAGLRPAAVTIAPVALQALLRQARATDPGEVVAYLDMGTDTTHILVLKGDEVRFSREVGLGGATLTEAVREVVVPGRGTVKLSFEEAEAIKREHGIPLGAEEAGMAGGIPLSAVSIMLRPALERLTREVWNSFDYCHEQFLGEGVTRVVLLGQGSRVRNLPEHLAGVLKIPVARADLTGGILEASGEETASRDASVVPASELAVGLAHLSRGALNFLAPPHAGFSHRVADAVPQRVVAGVAAVLLLSIAVPSQVGVVKERQRIAAIRAELRALGPRADALARFRAARDEETRAQELLARLAGGQVLWSYVLRDLSHRVGPDARLTELAVADAAPNAPEGAAVEAVSPGRVIRLTGLLRTGPRRAEDVLSELMSSLGESPVLDRVRLEGCESLNGSLCSFTLTARLAE